MRCYEFSKVARALDEKLHEDLRKHLDEHVKKVHAVWPERCDRCGATPELGMGEIYFIRDGEMLCEECNEREGD